MTRRGAVVRADALDGLTAAGLAGARSATACGRSSTCATTTSARATSLRARRPITTVHVPLDGQRGPRVLGAPGRTARSSPRRCTTARTSTAFPSAAPPPCARSPAPRPAASPSTASAGAIAPGRSRCSCSRSPASRRRDIAADYALSGERLRALYAARGEADQGVLLDGLPRAARHDRGGARRRDCSPSSTSTAYLRAGGLTDGDLAALRDRLVGSWPPPGRVRSAAR